ncbi:hypothetical protein PLESTB_001249800 [Pleodorina starrii]|uniref:Uncharacterized protein n=1 Tax=Pleodorina starrii TaxID=330485 RepID=A0A9W6BSN5_9CHLO|nr:hypothetical protein PLESTM_000210200 [Pleodorina starrii]GLC57649.1 hypothetical protein PLESTB_001249800 [Pleodorina starrii]GLC63319.1 hypothetical protein PLESTF_000023600 [Pleodorina starrii]
MEMLRNITAASAAASNPLLKSLLGPHASEAEYAALAEQAEGVWKMMDELAESDPAAYQDFVRDAAKAAREEVDKGRDPHVEGLVPELVLEAQAQQQQQPAGGPGPQGSASAAPDVARVVAGGQAVARVHIWAANDASGVKPPHTAGGAPVGPQAPAPPRDWSGLVVPVAEYRPATTRPGPLPMHQFHVACHVSGVRLAISGSPPAFRAAFLEAVTQFVEAEYRLQLSRSLLTLHVHRDAVSEVELQELLRRQQEHVQVAAGPGALADDPAADGSALPRGLLDELRSLNTAVPKPQQTQGPAGAAAAAAAGAGGTHKAKKALIEELN